MTYASSYRDEDASEKNHILSIPLHPSSLLELRKGLDCGTVMLDLEQEGLPGIVNSITNQMVDDKQFDADKRHFVNSALLLKHIHNNPEPQGNAFKRRLSSIRRMSTRTVDSVRKLSLRPESRAAIANRSMSMAAAAGGGGGTGVAGATVPTGRSGSSAAAPIFSASAPTASIWRIDRSCSRSRAADSSASTAGPTF